MLEYLYQALRSEVGVVIQTDNVDSLRQKLYAARREACDPALDELSLIPSPTARDSELWIVKKGNSGG